MSLVSGLPRDIVHSCIETWKVKSIWPRFLLETTLHRNALANLLPTHTSSWWPIIEDVFGSPACVALKAKLLNEVADRQGMVCISIDGTLKCTLPILGQAKPSASAAVRNDHPFDDSQSIRRVVTVRGGSGAVLAMMCTPSEKAEDVRKAFAQEFTTHHLQQVKYISTDAPSLKLLTELKSCMPQLQTLILDPMHLAMTYEYTTGRKRSPGSTLLRLMLSKFNQRAAGNAWGIFYQGQNLLPLTPAEDKARQLIESGMMSNAKCQRVLSALENIQVWPTRLAFIEGLAALSSTFPDEVKKHIKQVAKPLRHVLWSAASAERLEWLFNNHRLRAALSVKDHLLLPSGTTSNESLHAEMKGWFRETQNLHQATLAIKLDVVHISKLLAHNSSLLSPTARQMPSSHVLARRLAEDLWTNREWACWARSVGPKVKAALPLKRKYHEGKAKIKNHAFKRPSSTVKRPAAAKQHRTPFNLLRAPGVSRQGTQLRRPAAKGK
eukprot:Skav234406  [mRNA]  locus=scaffold873:377309:378793:+ [translate_table: standard]